MRNVLRVLKRDVLRMLKAPAALVVVAALLVLPSLYAWLNVIGLWDPYGNAGNLRVCVVNEDAGGSSDLTGQMSLGDQIVDELEGDNRLGWNITDRDTAMSAVRSGDAYAAFVIPEDFTKNLLSLTTGDFVQPKLEYYVNEKEGAIGPKITDTGATELDTTVNETFVSTASAAVADAVDAAMADAKGDAEQAQSNAAEALGRTLDDLTGARGAVATLADALDGSYTTLDDADALLAGLKQDASALNDQLQSIASLTASSQESLGRFTSSLIGTADEGSALLAQAAGSANASLGQAAGAVVEAQSAVDAALNRAQTVVSEGAAVADALDGLVAALPAGGVADALSAAAADLRAQADQAQTDVSQLKALAEDTGNLADSAAGLSGSVNDAVQAATASGADHRATLSGSVLPQLSSGLAQLSSTASNLGTAVSNQGILVDEASVLLATLRDTLGTADDAISQTDDVLAGLESSVSTARTDVVSLGTAGALSELIGDGGSLDAASVADFMASPTEVVTEKLYTVNAYGSAMAPLFMNLTLWIGVFMLMVILKLEVDDEGVPGLTNGQRYLARWLFLAPLVALQAVICVTGILIIGVQAASVPLLYVTAIVGSLVYLSIMYALSVTLLHVGKGLCVILVFVQIPGATGLYPIETTAPFFQAIYPLFPFTYGINALREVIAGFYGTRYLELLASLIAFGAVFFALGILARPRLTNLNRLFARQIAESDILNGEEVQAPPQRYRLRQVIRLLSDRAEFRSTLAVHAGRFLRLYPKLKRGAIVAGIVVPIALTAVLSLTVGEKVVLLTAWLVWLVLIIVFLVVVEFVRDSLERQAVLEGMSDDDLRRTLRNDAGAGTRSGAGAGASPAADAEASAERSFR